MILLIDDEKDYLNILVRILKKHGLPNYKAFSDFTDFLNEIKKNKGIAVAVIDHDLKSPGITGLDLMDIVHHTIPYCKTIICSGQKDVQVANKFYRNGCFYYLYKDEPDFDNLFVNKIREAQAKVQLLLDRLSVKGVIDKIIKDLANG